MNARYVMRSGGSRLLIGHQTVLGTRPSAADPNVEMEKQMTRALATALAAGAAVGLGMSGTASGQVIPWSNPAGGSWHVAANWNGNEPDTSAETAQIALAGTYSVSLTLSRSIGSLLLTNPSASLEIGNGASLTLNGAVSTADGLITINPSGGGSSTDLILGPGTVLGGAGQIVLNATSGFLDRARVYGGVGSTWTHSAGHVIRGKGRLYYSFINNGTLRGDAPAETLDCVQGTITNNGSIEATNAGTFLINSDAIVQTGGGQLLASGTSSEIAMSSASITGGSVNATAGGRVRSATGIQAWNGPITSSGPIAIDNGTSIASNGGLTHTGTILVNTQGGGSVTALTVAEGSTLGGTGTVTLNASSNFLDRAEVYSPNQKAWIHGSGHTINGRGHVYYALTNNGLISADAPGELIEMLSGTVTNTGTIRSTNAGVLQLTSEVINQTGSGTVAATGGGNVNLSSSTISGGSLTSSGGSKVVSLSGVNTLAGGVLVSGIVDVNDGTSLICPDGLSHSGSLNVNPQGAGSVTSLQVTAGQTLGGNGTVVLNATSGFLDRAQLLSPTQAAWTHGVGHFIRGRGNIYYSLVNNGTITADMVGEALQLRDGTVTNNATIQTGSGGLLLLSNETVNQSSSGLVTASNGEVRLNTATISGGTISTLGTHRIASFTGNNTLAGGVVVNGKFDVDNGTNLFCPDGLIQNGVLTINDQGGGSNTSMQVTAGTTLGGTGTVVLNATSGFLDRSYLASPNQAAWTHGSAHTIRGRGNVYYGMTNNGTITADMPGEMIQMLSGTVTNNATMQTAAGGILSLTSETVNQGASGVISASNGDVRLNSTAISGGTISATGGSRVASATGTNTLTGGVVVNGKFDVDDGTALQCPTGLTQNGVLTINPQGGGSSAYLQIGSGGELSGTGTTVLNATSNFFDRAYIYAPVGTFSNAHGHTISGTGNVYATWTNHGTVHPSGPSRQILCQQGPFTQATDGTLAIELSGTAGGSFDRMTGPQPKTLNGALVVSFTGGFNPSPCQTFAIVTGPIIEKFSSVSLPVMPIGHLSVQYHANDVTIIYYPTDQNDDGFINGDDFDAFVAAFEDGDSAADFNNDGFVTGDDFDAFVSSFESGC